MSTQAANGDHAELEAKVARGLEGVVAAATDIAEVDGERGKLTLKGYDVSDLSGRVSFEEICYLLWNGKLPNQSELDDLKREMSAARELPEPVLTALRAVAPHVSGMHAVRVGASLLSVGDDEVDDLDPQASRRRAIRLQAQMPAIVAHAYRLKTGQEIVQPKPEQGLAESFLYMLEGKEPDPARVEGMDAYFVAVAEHGLNASTFTGRVVISTNSDMVSALTAAVCSLKGSRHGGVPGPVLDMLEEIGSPDNAEAFIRGEIEAGRRIMGFGHRVYKVRDPRGALLSDAAEKMATRTEDRRLLDLAKAVEETTVRVLDELKPGRQLYANVELFAALILHEVNVPSELFTPCFAIGRTSGWLAHMIEQLDETKIIRPSSVYVGPRDRDWQPVAERE